jgi:pyrroloquinoline quinone biosynthesis protein B
VVYADATFFAEGEISGRPMAEVPHPFIAETIERLAALPAQERSKVRFVHLNHTNPAVNPAGQAAESVRVAGHHVARQGEFQSL